jgi:Flp pilus assembly pilin Flp
VASALSAIESRINLKRWAGEDGQTMAEYAVVLAVITPLVVAMFSLLGASVSHEISRVSSYINF